MRSHPQIIANEILVETEHPQAGKLRQSRQPAVFSKTKNEMRHAAPALGADTRAILSEAGFTDSQITSLLEDKAAFQAEGDS